MTEGRGQERIVRGFRDRETLLQSRSLRVGRGRARGKRGSTGDHEYICLARGSRWSSKRVCKRNRLILVHLVDNLSILGQRTDMRRSLKYGLLAELLVSRSRCAGSRVFCFPILIFLCAIRSILTILQEDKSTHYCSYDLCVLGYPVCSP